ncbi:hypothetical protein O3P69_008313 [Scylla paramamosain]|uniref:Inositol-pentakisphosphate 2-kinase n=1 Tax=Scylla paramamosain TaxID=85552 RepID=A0AAW0SJM3_SCYPA
MVDVRGEGSHIASTWRATQRPYFKMEGGDNTIWRFTSTRPTVILHLQQPTRRNSCTAWPSKHGLERLSKLPFASLTKALDFYPCPFLSVSVPLHVL